MHDTAYQIGGLVMDTYLPSCPAKILEIGAQNVNGTLRDHSPRNAEYIGLDFEAGDGVDIVITGLGDWNVPDGHFDMVMASSVFEHDNAFWLTFIEMCRKVKPGGHIYISAPSNGTVHRYPRDYWRFYPDSGLALEELARNQGFDLTLIESFVAEREADVWNDFCAVFQRGPCNADLNRDFVHNKVRCANAINWRSSLIINGVDDSQDTRLLRQARDELQECAQRGEHRNALFAEREKKWEAERARLDSEIMQMRTHYADEMASWTAQKAELQVQADLCKERLSQLQIINSELEGERGDHAARESSLSSQIEELSAQKSIGEQNLHERFREIGGLTRLIQERDQYIVDARAQVEWLRQVVSVLTRGFSTSRKGQIMAWLPAYFSHKRQKSLLKERDLFDADIYVAAYPDVSASKADPLRHFVNHGIKEGRVVKRGS